MAKRKSFMRILITMVSLCTLMISAVCCADASALLPVDGLMTTYTSSEWVNWTSSVPRYNYRDVVSKTTSTSNDRSFRKLYGPYYPVQTEDGSYSTDTQVSVTVKHAEEKVRNWFVKFEKKYITAEIGGAKSKTNTTSTTYNVPGNVKSGSYVWETRGTDTHVMKTVRTATYTDWAKDANGNYLYDSNGLIYEKTVSCPSRNATETKNSYDYTYGSRLGV